jgi:hypothetical protein
MKRFDFLEEGVKLRLKSTGSSHFYRTTGRDAKPTLGNRILKDFYDLDYLIPSSFSEFSDQFKKKEFKRQSRMRADIKKSKLNSKRLSLVDQ